MTPGRVDYEAYREKLTHSLFGGMLLPPWPMVDRAMQDAWEEAALAVIQHYREVGLRAEDDQADLTRVKQQQTDG
jgi:hypothetical protein